MSSKLKRKFALCGGAMAIALLAEMVLQQPTDISQLHTPTKVVAPQICPVCDFVPRCKNVPPLRSQVASVEPALPESGTLTPAILNATPEPKVIAESENPPTPQTPPSTQTVQPPAPPTEPQMGNARIVDGQKQVYFLGFGWIEDNNMPNEGIYVEDMYENGNKVGSMGGGIFVDGDGDINKMVGIMGGQEITRCFESEHP